MSDKYTHELFTAELSPHIGTAYLVLQESRRVCSFGRPVEVKIISRFLWLFDCHGKLLHREGREYGYPLQMERIAGRSVFDIHKIIARMVITHWLMENRAVLGAFLDGDERAKCGEWEPSTVDEFAELIAHGLVLENELYRDKIVSSGLNDQIYAALKQADMNIEARKQLGLPNEMKLPLFEAPFE